ncbi:hypothetical protein SAMN02910435_01123 [Ruminococcaceae bacterium D5]|jgi:phage-related protein predicted endonuclease-like protein|nr:hypothetical protein SAMN02910435_01123 [Ruminococcaceae bacterium D5]
MRKSDLRRALAEYQEITAQLGELEKRREAVAAKIKRHMGEVEEIQIDGLTVRYKPVTSNRFDSKAFSTIHESLYRQFCRASTVRRFTVA